MAGRDRNVISQDLLADPLIIAGVTLFIVAAAVMAVLTVMVRALEVGQDAGLVQLPQG